MTTNINYWNETRSGMRSSITMLTGAILAALSGILEFSSPYLLPTGSPGSENLTSGIWLLWIFSLWVLGISFIWVGNHPFLTHFGTVVGIFHLIQGTYLLMVVFTGNGAMAPPLVFTVGRLMTLFLFGLVERQNMGLPLSIFIWVTSLLQLLKITLRVMGTLPQMTPLVAGAVDLAFLLLICLALIQLSKLLRKLENFWAEEKYKTRSSGFADFNNPEHKWEKK
jgi:hypothetical protein